MCPPWTRPKTVGELLIEAIAKLERTKPELFEFARPDIDHLDYVGAD